ncbi:MAG: PorP/SprF family type IX secretion system membrane protein [Bacteroidales bacterium]|nr:PorP/SprF family type IX secretion system membrane protein [Bacteroidales bacterium]MBN2817504.1 PorP/SprF family type IX secretion system membrane protein [Bacteroidales bacterium]
MYKKLLIYTLLSLFCITGKAQQAPLYSQYILNEFIINPSVAGIDGMTVFNLSGRKQWLGYEYGPETYSASFSARLLKSDNTIIGRTQTLNRSRIKRGATGRVGLGASFANDQNGAVDRTTLNLSYAYHIRMYNSQLSFGLSLQGQQFKINPELAEFRTHDGFDIDPLSGLLGKSAYIPDAAFGVHYSTKNYSFGMAAMNLFQSPIKFGDIGTGFEELKQIRQYYYHGAYKNFLTGRPDWQIEPSAVIRMTEGLQVSADLSIRFIYNNEYWAGASLRTSGEIIVLMGLKFNRMYFGYSFDYGFYDIYNDKNNLVWGSHEAVLAVKLGDSNRRYRYWERY